tara:strand:- start:5219 stop:6175 length:957 start_codon:yes stop_codon:yes gene_type:complete
LTRTLFITSTRIGDAVLSSGLLAHLIQISPETKITVACGEEAAPIFHAVREIEKIITIKKLPWGMHWPKLWSQLVFKRWNTVVDLRSSAIAWLLIANCRLVLKRRKRDVHRVIEIGSLAKTSEIPDPRLWISKDCEASANAVIPKDNFIVIAPTANWKGKQWPGERFADLAYRVVSERGIIPKAKIVVLGAESERIQAKSMMDKLSDNHFIDLVGKLELMASAAVIRKASLFIGNDSALMHIAAALGVPTLGLFGPSREEHYAPWGKNCTFQRTTLSYDELVGAEGYDHLKTDTLMHTLSVDMAEEAVNKLWLKIKNK